ncbi:hypothetical protein ACBQ24_10865 [Acinetobacter terrestris]|uniref:hypothetical protein n=1 Tax=Acinetobacter terrestris TaxID=2529843 RepID=UPI0035238484
MLLQVGKEVTKLGMQVAPEGKRVKFGKMNDLPGTITGKTINQLLDASTKYTWEDNRRRFATGKYQTIPSTLMDAKKKLNLSGNELYDAHMQEIIFREHLLRGRFSIYSLITTGSATVDEAMIQASKVDCHHSPRQISSILFA